MARRSLRYLLSLVWLLLAPCWASAQFSDLDRLANQLAGKLKPLKPHKVAVALLSDASESPETRYFSSIIVEQIEFHGGRKVHVQDLKSFTDFLAKEKISASAISSPESLKILADRDKLDLVLFGALQRQIAGYLLAFRIIRLPGGEVIETETSSVPRTEFTESLIAPFPPKTRYPLFKPPLDGVSMPSCVRCNDPGYSSIAREKHVQGTVVMQAVISPEGRVDCAHVISFAGYGLDEVAFDTVRKWKLKPARDKNGVAVGVVLPVEVTFRMF